MNVVPKLTDLLSDLCKVSLVPSEAVPAMRGKLAELDTMLLSRLLGAGGIGNGNDGAQREGGRLLNAEQAAEKLGISKHAIYRKAKAGNYDFVVRSGRTMKFSDQGVERYIRLRMGK